jgi:hypothetical protein
VNAPRYLRAALLVGALLASSTFGCAMSPADRAATERAWAERDAERAQECMRRGLGFAAGGCIRLGGGA